MSKGFGLALVVLVIISLAMNAYTIYGSRKDYQKMQDLRDKVISIFIPGSYVGSNEYMDFFNKDSTIRHKLFHEHFSNKERMRVIERYK